MKKLITLLILVLSIKALGQDATTKFSTVYRDTLTATRDTVIATPQNKYEYYTIVAYTSSGTDSIYVDTQTPANRVINVTSQAWSQKGLRDLSTGSPVSYIIATTTPVEYLIFDPDITNIRVRTPDVTVTTRIFIQGKLSR